MCIWSVLVAWCCETLPTLFLNKEVIPQQKLFEVTAFVLLFCNLLLHKHRRFKPFQGLTCPGLSVVMSCKAFSQSY